MRYCVIRHPEVAAVGTTPETAYEHQRGLGWYRVSDWRDDPSSFHLREFAEALVDLDPPAEPVSTPDIKPAKSSKESKS